MDLSLYTGALLCWRILWPFRREILILQYTDILGNGVLSAMLQQQHLDMGVMIRSAHNFGYTGYLSVKGKHVY